MAEQSWCRDPSRDEAVRAAEDGREGPLPTLEEAISAVTERRPPEPRGGGNVTGMRTERVTLEIKQFSNSGYKSPSEWPWEFFLRGEVLTHGESFRVVEEPLSNAWAQRLNRLTDERDAAVRERDGLRAESERRLTICERMKQDMDQARFHVAIVQARVAELESAAKLAPAANAAAESNHAAPAASGAAGTEPVAWGVMVNGKIDRHAGSDALFTDKEEADEWCHDAALSNRGTAVALFAAPQPAKGWLTAKERGIIELARNHFYETCEHPDDLEVATLDALLARSSPPEVVHPECVFDEFSGCSAVHAWNICAADFRKALAAAGVRVKEVGK